MRPPEVLHRQFVHVIQMSGYMLQRPIHPVHLRTLPTTEISGALSNCLFRFVSLLAYLWTKVAERCLEILQSCSNAELHFYRSRLRFASVACHMCELVSCQEPSGHQQQKAKTEMRGRRNASKTPFASCQKPKRKTHFSVLVLWTTHVMHASLGGTMLSI